MPRSRDAIDRDDLVARLERLLARLGSRKGVRHAVLGVAGVDDAWSWSDAVGTADRNGEPMRPDTPWFIASVTKLVIAAVILRLSEGGVIDLEAPIGDSLPPRLTRGLHIYRGVDHTADITPVHLLGHFTGLPDYLDDRPKAGRALIEEVLETDRSWSPEEAVLRSQQHFTPHFAPSDPQAPRAKIRYSDTNYQLLVVIAEHATAMTMSQLYREILCEPLGLRHTWLPGDEPLDPVGEPAIVWLGNRPLVDRPLAMRSFGDLYSTVDDLLEFGRALFRGGVFEQPATAELMQRRFNRFGFPRGLASLRAPSWPIEYGLGMMRFELSRFLAGGLRIPAVIGHSGSTGSWLWYSPQLRLVMAGTVDQTAAATVPFRLVPRALAGLT